MNMAAPDYSDGCMIALYPPTELAESLAVEGGLPPEEMHVTVAYCGNAADVDADSFAIVTQALAERGPITGELSGLARFTGGELDVLVALVDSASLEDLRGDTLEALRWHGIEVPRNHGFTAHLTITYLDAGDPAPIDRLEAVPVEFTALSAVHGTDRTDLTLDPDREIKAAATEAFAAGWAASGGPMTERVRTACTTAVALAVESADDPDIFKATIDLGNLEGMWALLFQRREEQQAKHVAAVGKAWQPLIDRDRVAAIVDQFRSRLGLAEARRPLSDIASEALAAARNMLRALPDTIGWTKLRTAIRDAIAAGRAEGMVNAVAIAAQRAETLGLDWNIAFDHAYAALERLDELWADADGWLARTLDRATRDLGSMLADAAENGLSREEMIDGAMDLLLGDTDAVAFTVDWAMTTAADQGALDLYRSEGVQQVDVITAGDGRVCPACIDAEAGSPWSMGSAPRLPEHPICRCCYAADVSLAHFAAWFA